MDETSPRVDQRSHAEELQGVEPPYEGKVTVVDGRPYHYEKVPTGQKVWDEGAQAMVPGFYSLRTYFSHSTPGVAPGPGWDMRFRIRDLTPDQQMERYGHVFSDAEISNPMGEQDFQSGVVTGGMPDDIPYYNLVPDTPHDFEAERAALLARLGR